MELLGAALLVGLGLLAGAGLTFLVVVVSMARHLEEIMADVHRRASAAHGVDVSPSSYASVEQLRRRYERERPDAPRDEGC